jgi:16S rRNA G966 N2-methylase RsmD
MIQRIKLSNLSPNSGQIEGLPANPRLIKDDKFEKLKKSLKDDPEMLELRELLVFKWGEEYVIIGGNMRYRAAVDLDIEELPCKIIPPETPIEKLKAYVMKDNIAYGDYDWDMLANEWDNEELMDWGLDIWENGGTGDGSSSSTPNGAPANASLNERFIVPPFSILDTRKGYWQARKKIWREKIGDMGESRNDTNIASLNMKYVDLFQKTREHREQLGISFREYFDKYVSEEEKEREGRKVVSAGVSLLDPVMSELVCRWFGLDNCKTFDCFAGDSVFGHVSTSLGNEFTGIELRQEQVDLNNSRVEGMNARYICDDGQNVAKHIEPESQDLLFSCPPYFNLEVYSDKENDASNQDTYEDFIAILDNAFKSAVGCLKNNRFAVVVVGDIRNKKTGGYYGFNDDIKRIFKEAGCLVYNEIILVEAGGASLAIRAGGFMDSRKVGKMHQNILVFYKGDTSKIKKNFPRIDISKEDEQTFSQEFTAEGGEQQEEEFTND